MDNINTNKVEVAELHAHTCYSVQDAIPTHKRYVDAIYDMNKMSKKYKTIGIATTDHGNIFGLVKQQQTCLDPDRKEYNTKPIVGCEIYHCVDVNDNPNHDRFHLVILARTQEGLTNLYKIVSHGGLHTYKGRSGKRFPITDLNYILKHGKGLIALTACIGGYIPNLILNGREDEALDTYRKLQSSFDEVYLEVQPHNFPEQLLVNEKFVNWNRQYGYPLVMTSDSHYIDALDSKYHDILKDMAGQLKFTANNHLFTPEEKESFCLEHNIPLEALYNTGVIANKCNVNPKPSDHRALLPIFPCPKGYDESSYLRKLAFDGLREKIVKNNIHNPQKYLTKMIYELDVICNAGFAGYFLILWDWFKWCRENNILMGTGRGSAAGSCVAYSLNITKVDPIKNKFFFERFLNPSRLEFPDELVA